ncbi:hypothetical protein H5T87_01480 [bacterium]|nr:hypothetical protein [bacterium]
MRRLKAISLCEELFERAVGIDELFLKLTNVRYLLLSRVIAYLADASKPVFPLTLDIANDFWEEKRVGPRYSFVEFLKISKVNQQKRSLDILFLRIFAVILGTI